MTSKTKLDKDFLEKIKKTLLAEKERLDKELAQFTKKNPHNIADYDAEFPSLGDKDDENAAEVAAYSDNLTLERTLESSLRDVKDALKRIDEERYGLCRYCGEPIDPRRLEARPASSACILCKEKLSRR